MRSIFSINILDIWITFSGYIIGFLLFSPMLIFLFFRAGRYNRGVKKYAAGDYQSAFKIFHQLVSSEFPEASQMLGAMYYHGQGVGQDFKEAFQWFRRAAEEDYTPAFRTIGLMYYHGQGVKQDYVKALQHFRHAAKKGEIEAFFMLGLMYMHGQGAEQNYAQALLYFQHAAKKNHIAAPYLAATKEALSKLEELMTPEQIARAEVAAEICVDSGCKDCS